MLKRLGHTGIVIISSDLLVRTLKKILKRRGKKEWTQNVKILKFIKANTRAIWQQAAHTACHLSSPTRWTIAIETKTSNTKKYALLFVLMLWPVDGLTPGLYKPVICQSPKLSCFQNALALHQHGQVTPIVLCFPKSLGHPRPFVHWARLSEEGRETRNSSAGVVGGQVLAIMKGAGEGGLQQVSRAAGGVGKSNLGGGGGWKGPSGAHSTSPSFLFPPHQQ